jgi:hypothetical protein
VNVQPKHHYDGSLKLLYGDYLAIECEVISDAPTQKNRTVYVFLDNEDTTKLLLELRDAARRHRSRPLTTKETS